MIRNNNSGITVKLAKRSIKRNKRSNIITICAVALAAFMLITVLTVGVSYFRSNQIQNIRMSGGKYDAIVTSPSEDQIRQCQDDKRVTKAGLTVQCAWAEDNGTDNTLRTKFVWGSDVYWEQQRKPALDWVKGDYPEKENEVMISKAALKECAGEGHDVGARFTITYRDKHGMHNQEFIVSGIYEGYTDSYQAYVSDAFYQTTGYRTSDIEDASLGTMYLEFAYPLWTEKQQSDFESDLKLQKRQRFLVTSEMQEPLSVLAGIMAVIAITILSGCLLIYNILYLSVTNNIRYYGLLQTVGMTERQIKKMLSWKMFWLGAYGVVAGCAAGSAVSFFIIPKVIKMLGIRSSNAVTISFHPLIYVIAILLVCLTIYAGGRKPVKAAGRISPIEAYRYTPVKAGSSTKKTGRGTILYKMAWQNMRRDKKKTVVVILSLALSTTIFLCVVTMIQSQGARTIASNFMNWDMKIQNDTLMKEDVADYKQVFEESFIETLNNISGVDEIHKVYMEDMVVPWNEGFPDWWMRKFYDKWMTYPYEDALEEYQNHPEKFYSFMTGIDEKEFDYLNEKLDKPVDKKKFMEGETAVICQDDLEVDWKDIEGKEVDFYMKKGSADEMHTLKIAGMTNDGTFAVQTGMAPNLIVSGEYLKSIVPEPNIYKLGIVYQEEYDRTTEQEIMSLIQSEPFGKDMDISTKISRMENIKKSQGNMMQFGMGVVIVLFLIGLMNYINTMISNIQNRLWEMGVLNSIGMTQKQIKGMLMREGMIFAALSLLLTSTVGMGINYFLYQAMNFYNVSFMMPWMAVIGGFTLLTLICILLPLLVYYLLTRKKSIIEQVRDSE